MGKGTCGCRKRLACKGGKMRRKVAGGQKNVVRKRLAWMSGLKITNNVCIIEIREKNE